MHNSRKENNNSKVAPKDESGKSSPYNFERRPLGDDDVLIEIKFCGICHLDIHQII